MFGSNHMVPGALLGVASAQSKHNYADFALRRCEMDEDRDQILENANTQFRRKPKHK